MKNLLLPVLLAGLSTPAWSQTGASSDAKPASRWSLGVGAIATDSPYAGEGIRFTPFPLINYEGDRVFLRTTKAGVHLFKQDGFEVSALASLRMDGFDIDDLGSGELARNGLNSRLLDDRDNGLDAGLAATWRGSAGELTLELLSDVTSKSDGQSISLQYGYPFHWGKVRVTPSATATWLSKEMANYYYGTLDKEVARGAPDYKPGSAFIPGIGVSAAYPFAGSWLLYGAAQYRQLPSKLKDSPLLESGNVTSLMFGISRRF